MNTLTEIIDHPQRPLVAIIGGAKVDDKIGVIDRFTAIADSVLIGGAMCFAFLAALGHKTGTSLCVQEDVAHAERLLEEEKMPGATRASLFLPSDLVIGDQLDADAEHRVIDGVEVPAGWMGLDIGPAHRRALRRADREGGDGLLERPDGRLRARALRRAARARSRRPSRRRRG